MKYFWYWRLDDGWPPESVQSPSEWNGDPRLNVVCTQTKLSTSAQRKLVRSWCETFPTLQGVEYLWLNSRVPQDLFDAACSVPGLRGLYIKWSGIKTLGALEAADSLTCLHIGSLASVQSIEPLRDMTRLKWLGLANMKLISSLDPIGSLPSLEGLSVEGSMWSTQRVETLEPIGRLTGLKYLSLVNLRSSDATLAPLFSLRRLEAFHVAQWWQAKELEELWAKNPGLAG